MTYLKHPMCVVCFITVGGSDCDSYFVRRKRKYAWWHLWCKLSGLFLSNVFILFTRTSRTLCVQWSCRGQGSADNELAHTCRHFSLTKTHPHTELYTAGAYCKSVTRVTNTASLRPWTPSVMHVCICFLWFVYVYDICVWYECESVSD